MSIVNVEKVSRIYRQDSIAVKALDEVSVAIEAGEFTTLVGPSGSGKTTLLNQIGALDEPDSGRIQVAGEEITGLSRKKRTLLRLWKVGFVFQEYNLIGVLSAQENVEYVLMLRGVPFRERRAEARRILVEVGLQGLERRLPHELSGGQQQRVAVARAIVSKPAIVLADEPTANLDSTTGEAILDLLDELEIADDTVVVFTSDNGPHGAVSNAKPLRGSKGMFYEGGIREPFLIRWPGKIKASSRITTPIHQIDLLPTFASLGRAEAPQRLDGIDLSPLFQGNSIPDRSLFWHFPAYLQGYGKDLGSPFKHFRTTPCGVVRHGEWKLIEYFEDNTLELYNLREDPSEKRNRSSEKPQIRDELHHLMKSWRRETAAVVPSEKNPKFEETKSSR